MNEIDIEVKDINDRITKLYSKVRKNTQNDYDTELANGFKNSARSLVNMLGDLVE